jgi:hypothetical protein
MSEKRRYNKAKTTTSRQLAISNIPNVNIKTMEIIETARDDKLDALIAAPQHHRLLFENEFVRVLDANIPAGEMTNVHTHRFPASLYFISWSNFIRYDAAGNVLVYSTQLEKVSAVGSVLWSDPLEPHSLKNAGEKALHVVCVEIKTTKS